MKRFGRMNTSGKNVQEKAGSEKRVTQIKEGRVKSETPEGRLL